MRLYAEILNLHRPDTAAAQIHIPVRRSKRDIAYRDAAGRGGARCGRPAYGPLQIGVAARIGYDVEVAGLGIDVGQYPWRASIAACCADHDTGEAHLTAGHALSIRLQQQIADLQIQSQPKRNTGVHIGTQLHAGAAESHVLHQHAGAEAGAIRIDQQVITQLQIVGAGDIRKRPVDKICAARRTGRQIQGAGNRAVDGEIIQTHGGRVAQGVACAYGFRTDIRVQTDCKRDPIASVHIR